jgi:M3 family oligoendopeptidase
MEDYMKFTEFKYFRPNYEKNRSDMKHIMELMEGEKDAKKFYDLFLQIEKIESHVETMASLSSIRHTINTNDKFYSDENEYWDETAPLYAALSTKLASICLNFQNREDLYEFIPKQYFDLAECAVESFDEKIIPLVVQENKLASEYGKLKASAQIEYNGRIYNLSTISKLILSNDRNIRKGAYDAKIKFYSDNEKQFERIYDDMVKVRTKMAKEMGYNSYTELAYKIMNRVDYDAKMVSNYRNQILNDLVPFSAAIFDRQAERLGENTLPYYDESYEFKSGNAKPHGSEKDLVNAAYKMYHEMSPQTGEFINIMKNAELWDLSSRDGKEMGGYCTSLSDYKVPFIFANFNGTSGDVDVLTHEAGHAFQYFSSKNIKIESLKWPTMESAEIASMTMEFNAYPWLDLFFKEDTEKYKYQHTAGTITFLPYGVLVDHFQHEVYDHPEMTPEQRKKCWRNLEKQYLPHKDYSGCEFLESGGWWYQQNHIFQSPFYYIDYTLAQVCALQFRVRTLKKDKNVWDDYLHLVSLGGTLPFTGLCKAANIKIPFEDGSIKEIVSNIKEYLDTFDDKSF